jgi:hypothetical protein
VPDPFDTAGTGWGNAATGWGNAAPVEHPAPAVQPSPQAAAERPPVTGDHVVDEAVSRLEDLGAVALDEQPAVFDAVHRALQDRLADVEG